jgi:hypothetical protein
MNRQERNASRIKELHPTLHPYATQLIQELEGLGYSPLITQGRRTVEEQNALYAQGRTKPGQKVTNARGGESWHNYGLALDLGFLDGEGKLVYDVDWNIVGKVGQKIGFSWGGAWTIFKDKPHFEITGGLRIKDVYNNPEANTLIDLHLSPYVKQEPKISKWAKDAVEKAKLRGITYWGNPQEPVTPIILEQILHKLGLIDEVKPDGMTKERFMVALMRAKIL